MWSFCAFYTSAARCKSRDSLPKFTIWNIESWQQPHLGILPGETQEQAMFSGSPHLNRGRNWCVDYGENGCELFQLLRTDMYCVGKPRNVGMSKRLTTSPQTNQLTSQYKRQAVGQSVSKSVTSQPLNQPVSQPVNQPASQWVTQWATEWVGQPVSQAASKSVSQPINQPASQSTSQPVSKSVSRSESQSTN